MLDVLTALDSHSSAVLQAPPGAGKTTTVPLALLRHSPAYLAPDAPGSNEGKTILVLEPRRVAAKAAARRMAAILGEKVRCCVCVCVCCVCDAVCVHSCSMQYMAIIGQACRTLYHACARACMCVCHQVGETVGYRVRLETRVSRRTRIEVVTEVE